METDDLHDDRFPGTFEQWLKIVANGDRQSESLELVLACKNAGTFRESLLFYDQCANVAKFLTAEIKGESCTVSFMEKSEAVEWMVSNTFPLSRPSDLYRLFDGTGRQSVRFDFIYPFFFSR